MHIICFPRPCYQGITVNCLLLAETSPDVLYFSHLKSTTTTTTKTFRLTEDLRSNIRLDITLKPSLSIRDNRLDASARLNKLKQAAHGETQSSLMHRSMSCDSTNTMACCAASLANSDSNSNMTTHSCVDASRQPPPPPVRHPQPSENKLVNYYPLDVSETHSAAGSSCCSPRSRHDKVAVPYHTSIPINSSITFKIRNLTNVTSNSDTKVEPSACEQQQQQQITQNISRSILARSLIKPTNPCKRSSSTVMLKSSTGAASSLCRTNSSHLTTAPSPSGVVKEIASQERAHSPFTFIETYSVCKQHERMSSSPPTLSSLDSTMNHHNQKKARPISLLSFLSLSFFSFIFI